MFSALAAVCTVDCAIEIVLIILHYITITYTFYPIICLQYTWPHLLQHITIRYF